MYMYVYLHEISHLFEIYDTPDTTNYQEIGDRK